MRPTAQSTTLMIAGGVLILIGLAASAGMLKSRFSMVVAISVGLILLVVGVSLALRPLARAHSLPSTVSSAVAVR